MTDEEKERERENKIRDMIEWIDNDLLRASKYLLFLKEENKYLNTKVIGSYQIENAELKKELMHLKGCKNCTDRPKGELATVCPTEYENHCIAQKMQHIEELKAEVRDLEYKLKCRDDELAEARSQVEKMKRCFNCSKWFSNTEFCVSNERGTSICDKWEPAE